MPRLQLLYDLRRAPFSPLDHPAMYRLFVEQVTWADRLGFERKVLPRIDVRRREATEFYL